MGIGKRACLLPMECVMVTPSQINFDFTGALWGFVRSRFAFQAKQLKKLTSCRVFPLLRRSLCDSMTCQRDVGN